MGERHLSADQAECGILVADQRHEAQEREQDREHQPIVADLRQLGMEIGQMIAAQRAVEHPYGHTEHRGADQVGQHVPELLAQQRQPTAT